MGLFSFGNKDDARRRSGANVGSGCGEGSRRRTERAADADAMLLDPTLPEKQRARRRLVGAIALVVAAVVVLPMVLDSHPKPVTDDIAIDIPNRPATVPARANVDAPGKSDTQAAVASDNASGPAAAVASSSAARPAARAEDTASEKPTRSEKVDKADKSTQPAVKSAGAAPEARSPSSPKSAASSTKTSSGKEAAAVATGSTNTANTTSEPNNGSAAPGARFAVQLGVFADDSNAKRWESKLKAAGVPAYVEHRKQADGSTRSMLRAGPFADRAAASAAIAKVREAGLTANSAQ